MPESAPPPAGKMLVSKTRLAEIKREMDALHAERDRLAERVQQLQAQHAELETAHENLREHLRGSIVEIARLQEVVEAAGVDAEPAAEEGATWAAMLDDPEAETAALQDEDEA